MPYIEVLQKYAVFSGRATRSEFWMFALFHVLILGALVALSIWAEVFSRPLLSSLFGSLFPLYWLATLIPHIAVTVRRLHDTGRSGWSQLIGVVPFIGPLILFIILVCESDGDNQYGPARPAAPWPTQTAPASGVLPEPPTGPPRKPPESPPDATGERGVRAERGLRTLASWFFGGNTVVRVGVVVMFFGVAFFLGYAVEQGWFPIELRLASAALAGVGLLTVGWRLRHARQEYARALQGCGSGIAYLTAYAGVNFYGLVSVEVGLGAMVLMVVLVAGLAVAQDARSLAVLASVGGLLGPVLITLDASPVAFFSYYAALDVGIVAIAWFRAWRLLNLLGFVFTLVVGTVWGLEFYESRYFATTEPFLALFFVVFVAAPVLYAWRQPPRRLGYVDGPLVFGVPLAAFALQYRLVSGFEHGAAYSAVGLAAFYAALATAIRWGGQRESMRLLVTSFSGLSVAFAILMIPLAFDERFTAAAWALEGAALVWLSVRQSSALGLVTGLLLQLFAGLIVLGEPGRPVGVLPVLNIVYLGDVMVGLAGLFSAWCLFRHGDPRAGHRELSAAALAWGTFWWLSGGAAEIARHLSSFDQHSATLGFVTASLVAFAVLRVHLDWKHLAYPPLVLLPAMLVFTVIWYASAPHPLAYWGALAWPAAFRAQYWLLRRLEADWSDPAPALYHCGTLWLGVFFAWWQSVWLVEEFMPAGPTWAFVAGVLVPLYAVWVLLTFGERIAWPVRRFREAYLGAGQVPIVLAVAAWVLAASFRRGDPHPLGYVPLLNPVEFVQVLSLGVLFQWFPIASRTLGALARGGLYVLAVAVMNGVIARATHFLGDVSFEVGALWSSPLFQTALSVVWTSVAFVIMFGAAKWRLRWEWQVGAALLAVILIKLFTVDLADTGSITRIVSFVVVGGLILVIGYVSPAPPKPAGGSIT